MEWAEFERLFGQLAMQFSAMDYAATNLLHHLIAGEDQVVGATLTQRMPLQRKLERIKELSAWRLAKLPGIRTEVLRWTSKTKGFSTERNLFIHSQWICDEDRLRDHGKVFIADFGVEGPKSGAKAEWCIYREREYKASHFQRLTKRLGPHVIEGLTLRETLRDVTMVTFPASPTEQGSSGPGM